jgi:hypothetical protein
MKKYLVLAYKVVNNKSQAKELKDHIESGLGKSYGIKVKLEPVTVSDF